MTYQKKIYSRCCKKPRRLYVRVHQETPMFLLKGPLYRCHRTAQDHIPRKRKKRQ